MRRETSDETHGTLACHFVANDLVACMLAELTYSRVFAWLVLWPLLVAGVAVFRISGRTPWLSYWAMRRLYCVTQGRSNRWLVRVLGTASSRRVGSAEGVLFGMDAREQELALGALERDGFVVLGRKLTDEDIGSLVEFACATPARLLPPLANGPAEACFDAQRPLATKYDLPEHRLVEHPVVQRLLTDPSLRELACAYLRCEPVNDLVAMWWSSAFSSVASSEVAQLYHFDMDRPQFLKIFFYLTDVTPETGPHCYIRGSHRERPTGLWRDGRHGDEAVHAKYGRDREVEITAPRGTLIAVDTSGFHKGKPLARGNRLILQLEYTSALFGQRYQTIPVPPTRFWRTQIAAAPRYLARFSMGRRAGAD